MASVQDLRARCPAVTTVREKVDPEDAYFYTANGLDSKDASVVGA
jgi:hypothetical protein